MWKYNNSNELYHYGILGMRWHHRKRLKEYDKEYEKGANKILNSGKSMSEINRELSKFDKKLDKKYADSLNYKKGIHGRKAIKRELMSNRLSKAGLTAIQVGNALTGGYTAYSAAKSIENKRYGKALVRIALTALAVSNVRDLQKLKNDYTPKIKKGKKALKRLKYMQ